MKKRIVTSWISFLLVMSFLVIPSFQLTTQYHYEPVVSYAKDKDDTEKEAVQYVEGTDDKMEIYNRYKDNNFNLMNKAYEGLNPVNLFIQNALLAIKNFVFYLTFFIGKFNMFLVETLFNIDIASAISKPIQALSMELSKNLTGVASTIGLVAFTIFMLTRFFASGKVTEALKVLGLAILTFTVLAMFNNPASNEMIFNGVIEVDNQIENAFAGLNPNFTDEDNPEGTIGEKLSADILRTNIYEPYLFMNYGTANTEEIRKKTITYERKEYDRIGILLDNDSGSEDQIKMMEEITDIEVDDYKNNAPTYKSAGIQAFYALAYGATNLIQTGIFGILGLVRLALQFLLILMPFVLPILLVVGIFLHGSPLLANFFKGFLTVSFLKAGLSLATVVFTSYVSLAYTMEFGNSNILTVIITRLAWILAPIGLYFFRYFIGGLFSQNVRIMGGGLTNSLRHPMQAMQHANQYRQQQKEAKQKAREEAQKRREEQRKKKAAGGGDEKDDLNRVKPKNSQFSNFRNRQQESPDSSDKDLPSGKEDINKQPGNKETENTGKERMAENREVPRESVKDQNQDEKQQVNQPRRQPTSDKQNDPKSSVDDKKTPSTDERSQRVAKHQEEQKKQEEARNQEEVKPKGSRTQGKPNRQEVRQKNHESPNRSTGSTDSSKGQESDASEQRGAIQGKRQANQVQRSNRVENTSSSAQNLPKQGVNKGQRINFKKAHQPPTQSMNRSKLIKRSPSKNPTSKPKLAQKNVRFTMPKK